MGSPDRLVSLVERIWALNQRMEEHMRDPVLDAETRARMEFLHLQWREVLAANIATMEKLAEVIRAIETKQAVAAPRAESEDDS